jgi:hypothetical protein
MGLAGWRRSVEEAWFFIDSVDEAKLASVKFDRVVRSIAEGIHGAEERCHIFLSGRVTDWEPRRDFEVLKKWLSTSSGVASKPEPMPELLRILRSEHRPKGDDPAREVPFIAIMAPLDRERVHRFAEAAGIPQVEQFLKAVDDADLWHFARRPLDLDWLVRSWKTEARLGTLSEMVDRSITERLFSAFVGCGIGWSMPLQARLQAVQTHAHIGRFRPIEALASQNRRFFSKLLDQRGYATVSNAAGSGRVHVHDGGDLSQHPANTSPAQLA